MLRRSVVISPCRRSSPSARATASRDEPVHPASSLCDSGSVIRTPSDDDDAVLVGELDQAAGDAPGRVVGAELEPLPVGVTKLGDDGAQQDGGNLAVAPSAAP